MKIQPINTTSYKCHQSTVEMLKPYGKVIKDTGVFNEKRLDIYTAYDPDGNIMHKLYYLADNLGNWIESKLKYYKGGRCIKTIWSKRDER